MQRYAVVGEDGPSHLHIRYITGDPSSSVYFTEDRPNGTGINKSDCEWYNTWRYGFTNFTGTLQGKKEPQEYFEEYVKRDLVALVANDDTDANGDQYCMVSTLSLCCRLYVGVSTILFWQVSVRDQPQRLSNPLFFFPFFFLYRPRFKAAQLVETDL